MAIRIKIKDAKALKDSIDALRKKIKDADFDLTHQGVGSIANALLKRKDEIATVGDFASLRDIVKEEVGKFDTPKSREILSKVDEFDRMYKRDPRKGGRNDLWMWEKLLKYVYNIILKASGNESPDVALQREYKERKEGSAKDSCEGKDSCEVKDDAESDLAQLVRLLGEAHNLIMEANDLANDLEGEGIVESDLVYEIEDLESASSNLDFEGEDNGVKALLERFGAEREEGDGEGDEGFDGDASDWDV